MSLPKGANLDIKKTLLENGYGALIPFTYFIITFCQKLREVLIMVVLTKMWEIFNDIFST